MKTVTHTCDICGEVCERKYDTIHILSGVLDDILGAYSQADATQTLEVCKNCKTKVSNFIDELKGLEKE